MVRQAAQAESRSSLETRLPRHETELVEESRDPAAHGRRYGSCAVNFSPREKHTARTCRFGKERAKEHNRDAHSGVQSSDERAGRGAKRAPLPPPPPPGS